MESHSFTITVTPGNSWNDAEVVIQAETEEFGYWMCASEYLIHLTAQKSPAGYEKALELITGGAMTWRHKQIGGEGVL